ncbi:MAG: Mut7-C RNAse domain-containing protein [Methanobacteriota archaeon]
MKFIADGMLGKLARWLRLAGHDASYIGDAKLPPENQDGALLEIADSEKRMLLTADLALHKRAIKAGLKSNFVKGNDIVSQLVDISEKIGQRIEITPENSRCTMCNGTLDLVDKIKIERLVPESVLKNNTDFWLCVKCGKAYWRGGHWKTIIEMVSKYNSMVK